MANKTVKNRKSVSSRTWGYICLVLLLAITVFVSCIAVAGMDLDPQGVNVLLPWVPVSSENWPEALPVNRALIGGTYTDYDYTAAEGAADTALDDAVKTIRARLDAYGETDGDVSVKDGKVHVELRKMSASRRSNLLSILTTPAQFEFTDDSGNVIFTGKDVTGTSIGASYNNKNQLSSYVLRANVTEEALKAASGYSYLLVTMDGSNVAYGYPTEDGIQMSFSNTQSDYNTMYNTDFFLRTGAVDVSLSSAGSGEVNAPLNIVLKVVLWLSAALLALTLIYTLITGKLTGVSATLSVWCAVILSLFLVATVVIPSIVSLSVACLIAILLGIVIAMFTAVTRTDAISKQIGEGAVPKSATKLGFTMTAKTVWLIHGIAMALALVMMIFAFSRAVGYCLAAGVLSSALAVVIMRAYQACFTAITNKPALFGKVQ